MNKLINILKRIFGVKINKVMEVPQEDFTATPTIPDDIEKNINKKRRKSKKNIE